MFVTKTKHNFLPTSFWHTVHHLWCNQGSSGVMGLSAIRHSHPSNQARVDQVPACIQVALPPTDLLSWSTATLMWLMFLSSLTRCCRQGQAEFFGGGRFSLPKFGLRIYDPPPVPILFRLPAATIEENPGLVKIQCSLPPLIANL